VRKPYDSSASVTVLTAAVDVVGGYPSAPLSSTAVERFKLMSEPCVIPTREFACARSDLSDRNEARGSIGSGFAVWNEVCDSDTVSGNCKALTLLQAAQDRARFVSQFPLTDRCRHGAIEAQECYAL
jgi:hypothetical protein